MCATPFLIFQSKVNNLPSQAKLPNENVFQTKVFIQYATTDALIITVSSLELFMKFSLLLD